MSSSNLAAAAGYYDLGEKKPKAASRPKPAATPKKRVAAKPKQAKMSETKKESFVITSFSVPQSLKQRLDRAVFEAKQAGTKTSASEMVREALEKYLSDIKL